MNVFTLWLTTCLLATAGPAAPATTSAPAAPSLQDKADALAAAFERQGRGRAGIAAVDLRTNRLVVGIRQDELFMPASNQKLLTSIFALERLGADFRFATGVFSLDGNVVISGEFDPTLGDPLIAAERQTSIYAELDRWAAATVQAGKPGVRDVLVVTPQGWPARHPDWPAGQQDRWYAAPVGPLNFNDNCMDVSFSADANGRLSPALSPFSRYIRVIDRLTIEPGKRNLWSLRGVGDEATFVLGGTVGKAGDEPISVAVDRPDLLLGRTFADRLARAGAAPTGVVRPVRSDEVDWARAKPLATTFTPLFVALNRANKRSLNMMAEGVLLRAGDGTWAGSTEKMTRTLTETFSLPAGSLRPADGCGLSRNNRVSPEAMAIVLAGAARREDAMVLLHSLPIAGVDGTLQRRFVRSPCRGRVLGKTGYIAGVSCLSGYVLDEQMRVRYAFSVLANRLRAGTDPAKDLQESICELLYEQAVPPPAPKTAPATTKP